MEIKGAVDKVDTDNPQGLLFGDVLLVPQPDVNDDLGGFLSGLDLIANAQPAVGVVMPGITSRDDGVCEDEEAGRRPAFLSEPFQQQAVLVIEHGFETLPADISFRAAVNGVAD